MGMVGPFPPVTERLLRQMKEPNVREFEMREARVAVIVMVVALITTGAQALYVPPGGTVTIGSGTYDGIIVDGDLTISANAEVDVSLLDANGDEIGGGVIIGSAGGFSNTASLTVEAGVTLTILGSTTNDGTGETHAMDIGGQSNANAYFGPGSWVDAGGNSIGIGMDGGWFGFEHHFDPNLRSPASGYDTVAEFDNMTIDNHDGILIGLGEITHDANVVVKFNDTTISNRGWTSLFVVGGTVEISGTLNTERDRVRSYEAKNIGMTFEQANAADRLVKLKFKGVNPLWNSTGWIQTGQFNGMTWAMDANGDQLLDANGDPYKVATDISDSTSKEFGFAIDIAEATIPTGQWYSLYIGTLTTEWELGYGKAILAPGSEGLLRFDIDSTTGTRAIQVWVPEPATMTMLGIGGLGVLLRRKRR